MSMQLWVCKGCFNVLGVLLGLGQFPFNSLLLHRHPVWMQGNGASAFLWLGLPRSRWELKPFIYCTIMAQKETPLKLERRDRSPDWQMCIVTGWLHFTNVLQTFNLNDEQLDNKFADRLCPTIASHTNMTHHSCLKVCFQQGEEKRKPVFLKRNAEVDMRRGLNKLFGLRK